MSYIYQITNIITMRSYIGYTSRSPIIRFNEHYAGRYSEGCLLLNKAMIKYPKECFKLIILEEINENNWEEREQYWIKKLNTLAPNGYNISQGGNMPPIHYGEDNVKSKISNLEAELLLQDLINYNGTYRELSLKYNLTQDHIRRINSGKCRYNKDYNYPIRKYRFSDYIDLMIIEDLKEGTLNQTELEEKYKIKSRTRLYDLNTGRVGRKLFPQQHYPLSKHKIINRNPIYLSNPVETIPVIGK